MQAWAIALAVAFVVCGLIGAVLAPDQTNAGFRDAASVLAVISLGAVAIERSIEAAFAALSGRLGEWWPLRVVREEFEAFEESTNAVLGPVATQTIQALEAARDGLGAADPKIAELQGHIDRVVAEQARLSGQLADVKAKLAPGSARLARLGEINSAMTAALTEAQVVSTAATGAAQGTLRTAKEAAEKASLIIASFTDNPARRVASILMGASAGMVIAGGLGLNLFVATLSPPDGTPALAGILAGKLGVLVTGLIIGLGSSPTHEVVKSLQAYKESRAGADPVTTVAPVTATVAPVTAPVAAAVVIDEGAGPGLAMAGPPPGAVVIEEGAGPRPTSLSPAPTVTYVVRPVRRTG